MRKSVRHLWMLATLLASAVLLFAENNQTNVFTGTWKLNAAKSQFDGRTPPQSQTVTFTPDGTFRAVTVDAQGKTSEMSHPWSDGKEVPVTGIENATWVSIVHDRVLDESMKIGGKEVNKSHVVCSPDGKTLTVTVDSSDSQGRQRHPVLVFEKQ